MGFRFLEYERSTDWRGEMTREEEMLPEQNGVIWEQCLAPHLFGGHGGSLPDTTLMVPNIILQKLMIDSLDCVVYVKPDDCLNFSPLHSFSLKRAERLDKLWDNQPVSPGFCFLFFRGTERLKQPLVAHPD